MEGQCDFAIHARRAPDGSYSGTASGPDFTSPIHLTFDHDAISGAITSGPLPGQFSGGPFTGEARLHDYPSVLAALDQVLPNALFNPHLLEAPAYLKFHYGLARVAARAQDDLDLLYAFRLGWTNDPFSHF